MRLGKIITISLMALLIFSACGGDNSKNQQGTGSQQDSSIEILSPAEGITTPFSFITLEVNASNYIHVSAINQTIQKDFNQTIKLGSVVNDSLHYLYNVPLTNGVNEINVTAQTDDFQTISKILRINSENKGAALSLAFSKHEGTHTLSTQVDIQYKLLFEPSEYMFDSNGDGTFEEKAAFKKVLDVTYNTLGHFTAMVTLRTVNNVLYSSILSATSTVSVHDDYSKAPVPSLNGIKVVDIEEGQNNTLYILADDGKIYHFDQKTNQIINTITLEGVNNPQGFSVDGDDDSRLFIADTGNNRVAVFEKQEGVYKENITYFKNYQFIEGTGELEFKKIIDVRGWGESRFGAVMVLDSENNKLISLFTGEDSVQAKLWDYNGTVLGNLNHPINMSAGGFIVDTGNSAIRWDSGKTLFKGKELENSGKLYCSRNCIIADKQNNQLLFIVDGISKRIQLDKPPLMAADFEDTSTNIQHIFVAYEEGGFERLSYDPDANGGQPQEIVEKFIAALKKNDYAEMRRYCSTKRAMEEKSLDEIRAILPYFTHYTSGKDSMYGIVSMHYIYDGEEWQLDIILSRDKSGHLLIERY